MNQHLVTDAKARRSEASRLALAGRKIGGRALGALGGSSGLFRKSVLIQRSVRTAGVEDHLAELVMQVLRVAARPWGPACSERSYLAEHPT